MPRRDCLGFHHCSKNNGKRKEGAYLDTYGSVSTFIMIHSTYFQTRDIPLAEFSKAVPYKVKAIV